MTNNEEMLLNSTRAVHAARESAQHATNAAIIAQHNATRLLYAALASPHCEETNAAARSAQTHAALAEIAAEEARRALVALVSAYQNLRPSAPASPHARALNLFSFFTRNRKDTTR